MKTMREYVKKLQKLDRKHSLIQGDKVALYLSGSSDYHTAGLSRRQKNFMKIFAGLGYHVPNSNFPYNLAFPYEKKEQPPLWKAGISNVIYYQHTLWNNKLRYEFYRHLKPIEKAKEAVIVTSSSGLNILIESIDYLDLSNTELTVFALGPVTRNHWKKEKGELIVFKGNVDYYTRFLDSHETDYHIRSNHYNYCKSKKIKEVVYEWYEKRNEEKDK